MGETQPESNDLPTLLAVALLAYAITNALHEGLGHGGVCVLVGGTPELFNAIFFAHDEATESLAQQRWIAAGGSLINLAFALPSLALARRLSARRRPVLTYFLWLFASLNLLMAAGYLLFSGVLGVGDWVKVIEGLQPPPLWRAALALSGAALYFGVLPRVLLPALEPFLGADPGREKRTGPLCLLPYIAGGVLYVVAGLLNPESLELVLISAISTSFGGASLLAWAPGVWAKRRQGEGEPVRIPRSPAWILAGVVASAVFIFVLGPGVAL